MLGSRHLRSQTSPSVRIDSVSAEDGDNFSFGLRRDALGDCWGAVGPAGITLKTQAFQSNSAGYVFVCGIIPEAELMCWGLNPSYIDRFYGWVGWE